VGRIKIGLPGEGGRKAPRKLDWFEVQQRNPKTGEWERDASFHTIVGDTPKVLKVVFAEDNIDDVLHTELALYRSKTKGRFCYGDGETATLVLFKGDGIKLDGQHVLVRRLLGKDGSKAAGEGQRIALPGLAQAVYDAAAVGHLKAKEGVDAAWVCTKPDGLRLEAALACRERGCPLTGDDVSEDMRCKPRVTLRGMLMDAPAAGVDYVFRSTGWTSANGLLGPLELVHRLAGSIAGIPMSLHLAHDKKTGPAGTRKWNSVYLQFDGSLEDLVAQGRRRGMQLQAAEENRQLAAGREVGPEAAGLLEWDGDGDDTADLRREFDPEAAAAEDGVVEPVAEPDPEPEPEAEPAEQVEEPEVDF